MQKNITKLLSVLIIIPTLLGGLASCTDTNDTPSESNSDTVYSEPRDQKINSLSINGVSIADYTVYTPTGSLQKKAGQIFCDAIKNFTGYDLKFSTDTPSGNTPKIIIGNGNIRYEGLGAYKLDGTTIYIDGSFTGLSDTVKYFIHMIFDLENEPYPEKATISINKTDTGNVTEDKILALSKRMIYVRPNGNDDASGTLNDPVLTIRGAQLLADKMLEYSPAKVLYDIDDECYYVANISLTNSLLSDKSITEEVQNIMNSTIPGIICWGDSLTQGVSQSWPPYTETLQKLIANNVNPDAKVINLGVGGESSATITGRSGGIPFVLSSDIIIPADKKSVAVPFTLSDGKYVTPLLQGSPTAEVRIQGVTGVLSRNSNGVYTFVRNDAGKEVTAPKGSEVIFTYSEENLDSIPVIFMGQNRGGWTSASELVDQIKAIRDKYEIAKGENGKYIVIGLASGSKKDRASLEATMEAAFSDHFINLREYFSTIGPYEAKLIPTDDDLADMALGITPPCLLLPDKVHFTKAGFELLGKLVYKRMDELGYFDNIKNAINA